MFSVLQQPLPIERLVFSGGGARGPGHLGAVRALQHSHVSNTVKEVAGSSVGAMIAAIVAIGISLEEQRKFLEIDFESLLGNRVGVLFGTNPYGVVSFTRNGKPLEAYLRQLILTHVKAFISQKSLESNWSTLIAHNPSLMTLKQKLSKPSPMFTFRDLALLTQLFPEQFKSLTVTAVNCDGGELQLFNSTLTPDVEVALACRASSSLPLILEPVSIEINGVIKRFMDGGIYDNLPTDYFDCDVTGKYVENRKKAQTLVFAFSKAGEKTLHNALYGKYIDDSIVEMIIEDLIKKLVSSQPLKNKLTVHQRFQSLLSPTPSQIKVWVSEIPDEDKELFSAVIRIAVKAMDKLKQKNIPKRLLKTWSAPGLSSQQQIQKMGSYAVQALKPQVFSNRIIRFLERLIRDYFVKIYGKININYELFDRKQEGYHNLRRHYPLRTIALCIGNIEAVSFRSAKKYGRVLDALGYLDTIQHITTHNLANQAKTCSELSSVEDVFYSAAFYEQLVDNFQKIYSAGLLGAGQKPEKDPLLKTIRTLQKTLATKKEFKNHPQDINIQVYYLIKAQSQKKLGSLSAFALTRAVEFIGGLINAETLFKETYREGFSHSFLFSQSKITGETIFRNATLQKDLLGKNMFQLFTSKPHPPQTRRHLVYSELQKIERFENDPEHLQYCVKA